MISAFIRKSYLEKVSYWGYKSLGVTGQASGVTLNLKSPMHSVQLKKHVHTSSLS